MVLAAGSLEPAYPKILWWKSSGKNSQHCPNLLWAIDKMGLLAACEPPTCCWNWGAAGVGLFWGHQNVVLMLWKKKKKKFELSSLERTGWFVRFSSQTVGSPSSNPVQFTGPDWNCDRPTVGPIGPSGPVRFLKPWILTDIYIYIFFFWIRELKRGALVKWNCPRILFTIYIIKITYKIKSFMYILIESLKLK